MTNVCGFVRDLCTHLSRGIGAPMQSALRRMSGGMMVPVPGGVLIRSADGELLGAIGISGDSSDNDEEAALAGIAAVGLVGDPGS